MFKNTKIPEIHVIPSLTVPLLSHVDSTAASSGVVPTTDAKRNRVGGTRYYDLALQCPEVKEYVRLEWVNGNRRLGDLMRSEDLNGCGTSAMLGLQGLQNLAWLRKIRPKMGF